MFILVQSSARAGVDHVGSLTKVRNQLVCRCRTPAWVRGWDWALRAVTYKVVEGAPAWYIPLITSMWASGRPSATVMKTVHSE